MAQSVVAMSEVAQHIHKDHHNAQSVVATSEVAQHIHKDHHNGPISSGHVWSGSTHPQGPQCWPNQ